MPRVVILGATGFIGASVLKALKAQGRDIEVLCLGRQEVTSTAWIPFDLAAGSVAELAAALSDWRTDCIVNCSGATKGSTTQLVTGNVTSAAKVLDAVQAGVPTAHIVHLGSAAEYGATAMGTPVLEDQATDPTSAYGVCKLAATRLLMDASDKQGSRVTVLRLFNPIGIGSKTDTVLGQALGQLEAAIANEREEIELGSLDAHRDFVDVREVAEAVVLAALDDCVTGETSGLGRVINIGSGSATQVCEMVQRLARVAGFSGAIRERSSSSPRSAEVSWQAADVSRADLLLGWRPSRDLDTPLLDLWRGVQVSSSAPVGRA